MNLAPYSYFNMICDVPPMVMFCSAGWKDSVRNVKQTGEFVANFAAGPLAEAMNITSARVGAGVNEMELAGLEAAPSRTVKPPRVARAPASLECRSLQIQPLHDLEGRETNVYMVTGQVVGVQIAKAFLKDGLFDTAAARPLGRCGYRGDYVEVTKVFQMFRPE